MIDLFELEVVYLVDEGVKYVDILFCVIYVYWYLNYKFK